MKIDKVVIHHVEMPLVRPFRTSFGVEYVRHVGLIELTTTDGVVGWGECVSSPQPTYSHEFNDAAVLTMRDHLLPRLAGVDFAAEDVADVFSPVRGHPMARGALEMAALDAQLRASGQSFASYIGSTRTQIPCGVSVGIPVDDSIDTLLEHVSGYIDQGYRRIKLKIQPGFDIEPTRAVRSAWPEIPLQVDANQAYSRDHIDYLAGLDEFNLLLIEQPMHEDDLVAHKWLADRIETPVCLDESVISVNNAESLIDFGACEIVNIKAGRVGGYLEAKKIHDMAFARGIPVWCGGMEETGVGRAANMAFASLAGCTLPGDTSGSDRFYAPDVTEPFVMGPDGMMQVPTEPGIARLPIPEILTSITVATEVLA